MKLYVIRHGQTNSNIYEKLLSITDEDLNNYGYKQIQKVKKSLKDINFDICFSSNYKRTINTANIIIDNKCNLIVDNRLNERNFGILEGAKDKLYTEDFWNYYLNKHDYNVEPLRNLFDRTDDFLTFLKNNYKDKTVLVVSHAATIRAIHYNIMGFDESTNMLSFNVDNGKILTYEL